MIGPRVIAHMKTELPNVLQYCTNKIEASHNVVVGKEELYIIIYKRLLNGRYGQSNDVNTQNCFKRFYFSVEH